MSFPRHPTRQPPSGGGVSRPGGGGVSRSGGSGTSWRVHPIALRRPPPDPCTPTRSCEILALDRDGRLVEEVRAAPVHPLFDAAFTAIARGALVLTEAGPMAVEDLVPGIRVETRDAGYQTLMWRGSTLLQPKRRDAPAGPGLFRIACDTFGPQRPSPDLVLGPGARLVWKSTALDEANGSDRVLVPVRALEDGATVVRVAPMSPVRVFHLGFARHHIIAVNGLELETVHPGMDVLARMGASVSRLYLSLFPHLAHLSDFGPLVLPRLPADASRDLLEPL